MADDAVKAVRSAGFDDTEIVEMLGVMALSTLADHVSNVGDLDLDFPPAPHAA